MTSNAGWTALFEVGRMVAGQAVMIHGASGGVGHMMIQLAKSFDLVVIATSSNMERAQACVAFGADLAISRDTQDVVSATQSFMGASGIDAVVDFIGLGTTSVSLKVLAPYGRLIQIASRDSSAAVDLRAMIDKQVVPNPTV